MVTHLQHLPQNRVGLFLEELGIFIIFRIDYKQRNWFNESLIMLNDKSILITGGTGSFGQKFVKTVLQRYRPRRLIVYSRDEWKQSEMQADPDFKHEALRFFLGDVRDQERLFLAMRGVDYVIHAAALKQVGSCEKDPFEAVQTNIMGSYQACLAARQAGVKTFVAISTDKTVKPVNAMGTSKAMMEKMVCSQNQKNCQTVFCCVRYGNVMESLQDAMGDPESFH